MPPELRAAAERYFRGKVDRPTADDVAAYYRERDMACVVFTVDYATRSGREPVPNEEIARGSRRQRRRDDRRSRAWTRTARTPSSAPAG